MPRAFLEGSAKYALFYDAPNDVWKITFQGKIDDNSSQNPIESKGIDGVARGFFIQDATYGFQSLDGFVIQYDAFNRSWETTSLAIGLSDYRDVISSYTLDLMDKTKYTPNYKWACEVSLDPSDQPTYEQVYCTRDVP